MKAERYIPAFSVAHKGRPTRASNPDAALDLGAITAAFYQDGRYDLLIDYHRPPPPPPLSEAEAIWLDEWLRALGRR